MKAWILRHTSTCPPGTTELWLKDQKIPYQTTAFYESTILPDMKDFDLLFICGGGMNVDEEAQFPWLREEKAFIKQSLQAGKKMVGLCLGGQLIAEVLGARVYQHKEWELGWHQAEMTPLPFLPNTRELPVFQYHGYTFEIPKDATPFARTEACANQGFVWNQQALGFQFHPESTKEWVEYCSTREHPTGRFVQNTKDIQDGNRYQPQLQSWYFQTLDRFLLGRR